MSFPHALERRLGADLADFRRTGRWRSVYTADLEAGTLTGMAKINIHYYEQGTLSLCQLPSLNSDPQTDRQRPALDHSHRDLAPSRLRDADADPRAHQDC